MPLVTIDFTETNGRPQSRAALDLILGVPGLGAFAACPGDPIDNAPRHAIFYPNTVEGRDKYMQDSAVWEAKGRNNFLNSVVWSETVLQLKHAPLVIGPKIQPLRFGCLWVDIDKGLTEPTRELFHEVTKQSCIVSHSGGRTADGKPKVHIRLVLNEPITDLDEFYTMNRWFAAAIGADTKFSPVAWLTLPGSTRFKAEYPDGQARTAVKVDTGGRPWSVKSLRRVFQVYVKTAPTGGPAGHDATDLVAEPAPGKIPTPIRSMLRQRDGGDGTSRYKLTNKLVKLCAENGLTKGQAVTILAQHAPTMSKFGPERLASQVEACWPAVVTEPEEETWGGEVKRRTSLAEIGGRDYPEVVWAVPDIISEGLNMLVAPPKAGKSWFVLDIALACALGGKALGTIDVVQRPVLYMALEDSHRRLKQRSVKLLGHSNLPPNVAAQINCEPNMIIPDVLDFLNETTGKQPLVIIDTLGRARGNRSGNEDAYSSDYTFMTTLKNVIDQFPGSTMMLVHHTRKTEGADPYDSVNGSNGITGGVDSTLLIKRKRKSGEAQLHVTGREVGENVYALTFNDGHWAVDGGSLEAAARNTDEQEALSQRMQQMLDHVESTTPETVTPKSAAAALNTSAQSASMYLKRLVEKGKITKKGYGTYGGV